MPPPGLSLEIPTAFVPPHNVVARGTSGVSCTALLGGFIVSFRSKIRRAYVALATIPGSALMRLRLPTMSSCRSCLGMNELRLPKINVESGFWQSCEKKHFIAHIPAFHGEMLD